MTSRTAQTKNKNGHELAPLNARLTNSGNGVTIVITPNQQQDTNSNNEGGRENENRAEWSNKMQFMLSIIGYSVGLGNIWRFPYLCQQNGGGAFLIPFMVMLILEGIPLFLIELGIGQKMRLGSLGVWNTIHPWLGGVGISSCLVTFFVALYYNVIITWCFFYLFNSFSSSLPWASCPKYQNGTIIEECELSSETAYFWYRTTLDVSPNIESPGNVKWWIVLCLLLAWIIVFFIVMKGIQSSGRVVYFTSMFPYIVLTIFFIRGITLPGAGAGLVHMYTPKVEKLLDPNVWLDAATQVFYSFGLAFGSLIAFGSYNQPNNNCVRDVILVSVCNALTAIYASVVVFAILGFKAMSNVNKCIAHNKHTMVRMNVIQSINLTDIEYESQLRSISSEDFKHMDLQICSLDQQLNQAAEGTGLAFIVFTQAIVELPGAPFWSMIFFMMLLSLGLGSQIGILEGVLCTIFDIEIFKRVRKPILTGVVCLISFLVGLIFTTGAGEYWLKLFDSFAGTIGLVLIALIEMLAVMFIYGHEKFTKDIFEMTGYKPGWYWQITWRFLGPAIMSCILVSSIICRFLKRPSYGAWDATTGQTVDTEYPDWILVIAIAMITVSILPIFVVCILRRSQCIKYDMDIHQAAIRRIETTVSTKEMVQDVDSDEFRDEEDEEEDDGNVQRNKTFKMEVMDF
uniref:Transporter n=2 Tax=Cacopsylla melanoneura TaxID=428564 RepID=A0A8D8PZB4_9HEMI